MSIFDKPAMAIVAGRGVTSTALLLGALLTVALWFGATPDAMADSSDSEGAIMKTAMQTKRDKHSGYELRCWQEGRLILQENDLQAPANSAADVLRMNDRNRQRVRVLETKNATCLLKKVSAPRRMLRP